MNINTVSKMVKNQYSYSLIKTRQILSVFLEVEIVNTIKLK